MVIALPEVGDIPGVGHLVGESAYLRDFSYRDDSRQGGGSRRPYSERMQAGDFPRAAIIAGRLDVVPHTGSTNADLLAAVAGEPDAYPHLSVLVTDDQRAGRGRLDRTWTAPPGAALAISVLLRVPSIPTEQRGWVSLIAGAAMTRALRGQFAPDAADGGSRVGLKWPNDVLIDGAKVLDKILYYMPLTAKDKNRMVERFVSVSRATLKGTFVIGLVQGGLAGMAFAVLGVNGAFFWGTIMAVLSIIPGVGVALVWIPAAGYLLAIGKPIAALLLTLWCVGLVGTVDNVLRPRLVGKDTKMPDLLILLGTLGGLVLFGAAGIIVGPVVAALFVTVWEIYGTTFKDVLPPTALVKKA